MVNQQVNANIFGHGLLRVSLFGSALLVFALLSVLPVSGQSFKATVVGRITDPNGAAVPGVSVTLTETGTGSSQSGTTDDDGSFTIPQLPPGRYDVRVEGKGFKAIQQSGIVLETASTQRLDFTLEVGDVTEMITVVADLPVINTDTSDKGEVITPRQVQELPLNGRNFTDLALLVPGVYRRPADDDQGEGLATAGTRTDSSNFILDGVVNRSDRNASVGVNTSVDSIREFKVETSTYSAEYGRTAGAQINVVSKSGTNKFNGSAFEYLRNDVFDANNFFTAPGEEKKLRRNQFGFTVGGPMPFFNFGEGGSMFNSGKDRTFFFVSYEGTRERRSVSRVSNAPRAEWLRGDFSALRGPGSDGILGNANDTNRVLCLTTTGAQVECPVRNVIPFAPVPGFPTVLPANPLSLRLLQFLPAANDTATNPTGYAATLLSRTDRDQFLAKVDHRISTANNFSVRYARQSGTGFDPFPSERNFYPGFGRDTTRFNDSWAFTDTHVFSPQVINEARVGHFKQRNENLGANRHTDFLTEFGITGLPTGTQSEFQGFPAVRIDGFSEWGDRPNDPFIYNITNTQFFDMVSLVTGTHSLKIGGDIIRSNYKEADVRNVRGDFRFRGRNTHPSGSAVAGFYSFADFLYGLPDATQRQIGADPANLTGWQYAFFVQDDWRVRPWLTLNLGLRYELQTPLKEATGRLANFVPEFGAAVVSGDPRLPTSLVETDKNNWGPRAGFAMRPFGGERTVIRGGAGIYYSLETFNPIRQQLAVTFPFIQREQFSRLSSNRLLLSWQNPFPSGRGGIQGLNTPFGLQVDYETPEFYQYNLTLERELMPDLALELGYVGSQGRHLGVRYNLNQPLPTGAFTVGAGGVITPVTARRFPALGDIQFQEQIANSSYNAFQTSLRRRQRNGLTLLISYTFSRSLDTASSTNNSTTGAQRFPQDIRDRQAERGLSDFHRAHQFSASFNYSLPFGRGRAYGAGARGALDTLIGGWQLNGIVSLLSGRPFTPQFNAPDLSNQRPDIVGDPYANIPPGLFFNPNAFSRPVATAASPEQFGNAGRNTLIGPSFKNLDLSLLKNFRITEKVRLQFRAESFNILNHPNFQVPVFLLDRSDVGRFTATANEGREFQFAVKVLF